MNSNQPEVQISEDTLFYVVAIADASGILSRYSPCLRFPSVSQSFIGEETT